MKTGKTEPMDAIAVIGMSGRFPGAKTVDQLWDNLCRGVESISTFTTEEILESGVDPALIEHPDFVPAGGALEDIDLFDAQFFGFNPRDAELLDPQQRLFLECAWESLENAGYVPDKYDGPIGVFGGASMSMYALNLFQYGHLIGINDLELLIGNDKDYLCTRTSYKLNLTGPSISIQTACSTSLVAVSLAVQSLRNRECDMALAGGVTIGVPAKQGYIYQEGGISSPDGHCRAFDAAAKGTVGGNGVGIVVLKRLRDAIADRDHLYAVVRGAAINNDGSSKVGYTAPSVSGQARVIETALGQAGIEPDTIEYIEAHGTATPLGDPIEAQALKYVFGGENKSNRACGIGSIKTSIGHLDTAAGVAGFIKTCLALYHEAMPASLHFEKLNPEIDFADTPFYVNASHRDWPRKDGEVRRAGVSSFGIGGTNAHVVLEEAPLVAPSQLGRSWQLLTLSAKSKAALAEAADQLSRYLESSSDSDLGDSAFTLHVGRKEFEHRRAVVCRSRHEAISALRKQEFHSPVRSDPRIVFMFPGQGAQASGMARELYEGETFFREEFGRCANLLQSKIGVSLVEYLFDSGDAVPVDVRLDETSIAQPALFAVEYALARLWMHWGVRPHALIGHSLGELTAACLSGVVTLEDATTLIAARAKLMQAMPPGAMLSVLLQEDEIAENLDTLLNVAVVNGPSLCTVAGPVDAIERYEKELNQSGVTCKRLRTSHAFHSPSMEDAAREFEAVVRKTRLELPRIPFISNVSGHPITNDQATDPTYWRSQLRKTVRFSEGLASVLSETSGTTALIEVGPGRGLSALVNLNSRANDDYCAFASLSGSDRPEPDTAVMLQTLGQLWTSGVSIDWHAFHDDVQRRRLPLPTYPFERQRYWLEVPREEAIPARTDIFGRIPDVAEWFYVPSWTRTPLAEARSETDLARQPLDWLLFTDSNGLASELSDLLRNMGHRVAEVEPSDRFEVRSELSYCLDPGSPDHYRSLVGHLARDGFIPDTVVNAWGLFQPDPSANTSVFDQCQSMGFYSLLYLAQALSAQFSGKEIDVMFLADQIHSITGGESILPAKATSLGASRGIAQECPSLFCRHIELVSAREWLTARNLLSELLWKSDETVVALCRGSRWVQTFLPRPLDDERASLPFRDQGVYVITGGLGQIGTLIAGYLARTVGAKLVLVGRTELPERQDWDTWLNRHNSDDRVSEKILRAKALEDAGADMFIAAADVSDPERMKAVLETARTRFGGEIHGVIHGAGTTEEASFRMMTEVDAETAEEHFSGKARGLMVLHDLLGDEPEFYVLLSSISTVLGGLGFIPYAASNHFMNAFAERQNQSSGARWISINWDGWSFEDASGAEGSDVALRPEGGLDAFGRIMAQGSAGSVIVSVADLFARIEQWARPASTAFSPTAPVETVHRRPDLQTSFEEPTDDVEQAIAETWQFLLGIDRIGVRDNFFELGGHSLLAIQLTSRIQQRFRVQVSMQNLFDNPTVVELADVVRQAPSATDTATIVRTLDHVESLTQEELQQLLDQQDSSYPIPAPEARESE